MRKLIVSMNVTLDGFMAGPGCELDWHFNYWNDEMADCAGMHLTEADTILLGRITYTAMAEYWPLAGLSCPRSDIAFADMMNNCKKIVLSRTLEKATWKNTSLEKKNARKKISGLKYKTGKNILVYGSGSVVSELMQWGLIDEYMLWIHPVILGKGKQLFTSSQHTPVLKLIDTKTFKSGVVLVCYRTESKLSII